MWTSVIKKKTFFVLNKTHIDLFVHVTVSSETVENSFLLSLGNVLQDDLSDVTPSKFLPFRKKKRCTLMCQLSFGSNAHGDVSYYTTKPKRPKQIIFTGCIKSEKGFTENVDESIIHSPRVLFVNIHSTNFNSCRRFY